MLRAAIFLDRDGTINVEKEFASRPEDLTLIEGAATAIRRFNELGYQVVVISNQSGVARGYHTEEQVDEFHDHLDQTLKESSAKIDAYYYCPHHPEHGDKLDCDCRKPAPGLFLRAAKERQIDLTRSFMIGDRARDLVAAVSAGVSPIMVATGYGKAEESLRPPGSPFVDDILTACKLVEKSVR